MGIIEKSDIHHGKSGDDSNLRLGRRRKMLDDVPKKAPWEIKCILNKRLLSVHCGQLTLTLIEAR